ncbi:alkaline phosphatase family protein [soil metagenome]
MSTTDRVLILGLDGATWTVLDPARRRGWMPNLDALLARSAWGTLRSVVPPMTGAAWATMQTGCDPQHHGIFDHRYFDRTSGQMKVNHSGRIRVPTLWQVLDRQGRSVVSLNLPGTYPPPKVRGVIVSGMDAPHLDAALSGYPEFAERLRAEVPRYDLKYQWKRVPESLDEFTENARQTVEGFLGRAEGGLLADRLVPDWSALMVQFQNLDPFQHRAWRYLNVDETGIDNPPWNEQAGAVLRGLDQAIGWLCELAEKRGAAVLAVSDHGFGPCLGRLHVNRILIDAGLASVPGLFGRVQRRATQGADRLRLWDAKRHDRGARSASFAASVRAQYPFDWKRTAAFAPHQDTAAMVYLNRSSGPLTTARQVDDACKAAVQALAGASHPETGRPLFPMVFSTAEAYGIDPADQGYPDLIALPDDPYWVRTKLSPGAGWVEADAALPGTHRLDGIYTLSAPGVAPGAGARAELRDVSPTVLALLGLAIPEPMRGQPFAALPAGPVRRDDGSNLPNGPHRLPFEYSAEEQAIIEQRLSDLGYLE